MAGDILTTIDSTVGEQSNHSATPGLQVEGNAANKGFAPFQVASVSAYISQSSNPGLNVISMSLAECGVATLSGSGAVLTLIAPLASSAPGAQYFLRSLDARAHVITGSLEAQGRKVFCGEDSGLGSKVAFDGTVGTSLRLQSDGLSWVVLAGSGSFTISGT